MSNLQDRLDKIEQSLRDGSYRPGPWKEFLADAGQRSMAERKAVESAVDRVSDLLHMREGRATIPLSIGLGGEVAAAVLGGAALETALQTGSNLLGLGSLGLLVVSFQPLVKMGVGAALGIRYSYAFMWGAEPRFKMRYGTYLAASRTTRALVHLAGCIGSPIGAFIVARRLREKLPLVSKLAALAGWSMVGSNTVFFVAGLKGMKKVGPVPVAASSGGALGEEVRTAR